MRRPEKLNLKEHVASKEKKQRYANHLFETIAARYDFFTVFMSYGMDRRWKREMILLLDLKGEETTLDIACGTGDIAFMTAARLTTGRAIGLDITQAMLQIAERKRRARALENVCFHRGDIMNMPFADQTFDYVTGGYALRNVPDLAGALREIYRVLKPGGRFLSLDFGKPRFAPLRWLYLHYLMGVGAALGFVLHRDPDTYRYIAESLKLYPGQYELEGIMKQTGFVEVGHLDLLRGIMAINWGRKPKQ